MRSETISESITVAWRDERKGRATVNDMAQAKSLLAHFELPSAKALPFAVDSDQFRGYCGAAEFPCTVTIERKPMGTLQEAAWAYAEESGMARIVRDGDELGVLFLDEDHFVPFSRLAFDPATGFQIVESDQ
jgi:hypothetical protein